MLEEALANYTDTDNGYDDAFNGYVEYVNGMIPYQIGACMSWTSTDQTPGPCNQYFTCQYSLLGASPGPVTACPPPGKDFTNTDGSWNTCCTLVNGTGFWSELANYGVTEDWVQFGTNHTSQNCSSWVGPVGSCIPEDQYQYGYPMPAANIVVPDPRDLFTNASMMNYLQTVDGTIQSLLMQIVMGTWDGFDGDIASALVLPVSMAVQASQAVAEVVVIGNQENQENQTNKILQILGAVFMIVPFVGDGPVSAASDIVSSLGRVIALAGSIGNAGLGIYDIIQDPNSAPMAILGILGGVGGVAGAFGRDPEDIATMAGLREDMSDEDVAELGSVYKENDGMVQDICNNFCGA